MSAESSSASGNLSKETPANGTHRDCRSRQRYDYNDQLDRGCNSALQLRHGNFSTSARHREASQNDDRLCDQGRSSHLNKNWRENRAGTTKFAADFIRGPSVGGSGSSNRRLLTKPRDRLFEDYVREPNQPSSQKEKQQLPCSQKGQQQNQQQQQQPPRRDKRMQKDESNDEENATTSRGHVRDRRSGSCAVLREADGANGNTSFQHGFQQSAHSDVDLIQPVLRLNVHAQEFTPAMRAPSAQGACAATQNDTGVTKRTEANGDLVTSNSRLDGFSQNDGRGDTSASVPRTIMLAMSQVRRDPPRSVARKQPIEESKAQKESMEEQLLKDIYDCVICCSRIRATQSIWNCQACFHIFHLRCIAEWAETSLSDDNKTWRCPACQGENSKVPRNYWCFCRKQKNPQPSKMSLPHSCTELCQKSRSCPHKCNKLCHPGRCPPCEASVSKPCQCGKTSKYVKCSSKIALICGQVCGMVLSCAKHECQTVCHPGDCESCKELKDISCFCGKNTKQVLCAEPNDYSCDQICKQMLSCGNHHCEKTCHRNGECGECQLSLLKSCPCGRSSIPNGWDCSKPVPLCDAKCGRKFQDCEHLCEQKCHEGDCPPCPALVKGRRCRCGAVVEEAECGEKVLVCRRRCNKKKTCGRHKCLDECCDKEFHICDLVCGKKLSCGIHSCFTLCHKGICRKCQHVSFDELRCHCGHSVVYPPVPCNTPVPECKQLCAREHRCRHPVTHPCHSEPVCPPCTSLTEKKCHGGHELRRNIPCHLDNVSCGRPCGRPLSCGRHSCDKTCHAGECPTSCEQPCKVPRKCGHPCKLPCHDECPTSTCFTQVEVSCTCGRLVEPRTCHEFQQAVSSIVQQKVRRGEEVNLAKDLSQLSKGILKCVERCAVEERNRRFAEALKINPDAPVFTLSLYSDFVKEEARKNWHFASKVVNKLNDLVELAKNSVQASRSYGFEPMPREQRRFIYELLEVYRCTGQSYDQEPKRNIVVTAYKDKSVIPSMSLASAIGIVNPIPLWKM
ncbi:transcriptional repressor NF-X1-like [Varroa destructor]|uniref:Shuttle craft n=1 Tax=Varroa destructor TaxID=109461 RepID=A0A7M7K6Z6_VARDE|nr:transcriptional repressor NF-X1-like [Varroa destructor]XP_022662441.1 transcriptional repressor NF-X1-like [Varroa destructor]